MLNNNDFKQTYSGTFVFSLVNSKHRALRGVGGMTLRGTTSPLPRTSLATVWWAQNGVGLLQHFSKGAWLWGGQKDCSRTSRSL